MTGPQLNPSFFILNILLILPLVAIETRADDKSGHSEHKPSDHVWTYNIDSDAKGPKRWADILPDKCGPERTRQSPIDIETDKTKFMEDIPGIDIISERNEGNSMALSNNGHTAQVSINGEVFISGGGIGDKFRIVQFHFHWGSSDKYGSEHFINGFQYPLEMHMVSYDTERYPDLTQAVSQYNSLAVLGTLVQISSEDNPDFQPIIDNLKNVTHPSEKKVEIAWIDLEKLLPKNREQFYRYEGSLTTPTCDESAMWIVFANGQRISQRQLDQFRQLHEGTDSKGNMVTLVDNFRPTQPLHQRIVYSSFVTKGYDVIDQEEGATEHLGRDERNRTPPVDSGPTTKRSLSLIAFSLLFNLHFQGVNFPGFAQYNMFNFPLN